MFFEEPGPVVFQSISRFRLIRLFPYAGFKFNIFGNNPA